ncbi:MAG: NTP transferase domain-containing protein [Sulfolobaceae archaeon]|nr:NTP transferase domain-containing protein [Sulfolobaceae archaeon]
MRTPPLGVAMDYDVLILAGGEAKRFGYVDKCMFNYLGKPILFRLLEEFDDAYVVSRHKRNLSKGVEIIETGKREGPLGGVKVSLPYLTKAKVFITGCDYPFVCRRLTDYMCKDNYDITMVLTDDVQPLLGCYMVDFLKNYVNRVRALRELLHFAKSIKFVGLYELRFLDPELKFLVNVNTLQDFAWNSNIKVYTIGKIILK